MALRGAGGNLALAKSMMAHMKKGGSLSLPPLFSIGLCQRSGAGSTRTATAAAAGTAATAIAPAIAATIAARTTTAARLTAITAAAAIAAGTTLAARTMRLLRLAITLRTAIAFSAAPFGTAVFALCGTAITLLRATLTFGTPPL